MVLKKACVFGIFVIMPETSNFNKKQLHRVSDKTDVHRCFLKITFQRDVVSMGKLAAPKDFEENAVNRTKG